MSHFHYNISTFNERFSDQLKIQLKQRDIIYHFIKSSTLKKYLLYKCIYISFHNYIAKWDLFVKNIILVFFPKYLIIFT